MLGMGFELQDVTQFMDFRVFESICTWKLGSDFVYVLEIIS